MGSIDLSAMFMNTAVSNTEHMNGNYSNTYAQKDSFSKELDKMRSNASYQTEQSYQTKSKELDR